MPSQPNPSVKPLRQLGYCSVQPSSRLVFSLEIPTARVIMSTVPLPASKRATQAGTRRGGLAPSTRANSSSTSRTGAGSSS
jgi:hypothetical protein